MIVVRPKSKEDFNKIIKEAKEEGKLIYISANPCPECEIFEASLEELNVETDKIVKVDVPAEEWAVDFVLNELGVPGSPSIITPDGKILDDFDPIELAKKVKAIAKKES